MKSNRKVSLSKEAGILTFLPILITLWTVTVGERRRRQLWRLKIGKDPGEHPAILIVDLHQTADIKLNVEQFLQRQQIQIDASRWFVVNRTIRLTAEHMPDLAKAISDTVADIIRSGADVVHVFYAGPVVPAMFVGVQLRTYRALLYQWNQTISTFEPWGPLHYP